MSWYETQSTSTSISATEWNNMVTYLTKTQPDYVVSKSGTTITAHKTSTGAVLSSGTVASTVIQAAIDDAESSTLSHIHIKTGVYTITTTLTVNGHLTITGDGSEFTELIANTSLNTNMLVINSGNSATQYRVTFIGIKFDGNNDNVTSGSCIVAYGIIQSHFLRCHFENIYDYGLYLYDCGGGSGSYGHHTQIIDCLFDSSDDSSGEGIGIYMKNNDENTILACQFQYMTIGVKDESGFNQIESCSFVNGTASTTDTGIYVLDCSRTRIINCIFDLLTGHGIHLKGAFNIVNGCTFYGCGDGNSTYDCIYIEWYGRNQVCNNIFMAPDSNTRYGINEVGNVAEDTYGYNTFIGNQFYSVSGATTLTTSQWGSGAINETNTNLKSLNYAHTSSGAPSEL